MDRRTTDETRTRAVLDLVLKERREQEARYGSVSEVILDGSGPGTRWLLPYTGSDATQIQIDLRTDYEEFHSEEWGVTWVHLVREEIAEAFQEDDPTRLAAELIQVAALCVSWVERLDFNPPCPRCGKPMAKIAAPLQPGDESWVWGCGCLP